MEVFNATNDFLDNQNIFKRGLKRLKDFFNNFNKKQWVGLVIVILLVASITLTLGLSQRVQKFFSKAFSGAGSYGSGGYGLGNYSGVLTSTPSTPSPTVFPSASVSSSPLPTSSFSPSPVSSAVVIPSASPEASESPSVNVSPSIIPSMGSKGDGNGDGKIDFQDLSIMFSRWSPIVDITSGFNLDFDDNKKINSLDYSAMTELLSRQGVIGR